MDVFWSNFKADTQKLADKVEKVCKTQTAQLYNRLPTGQQAKPHLTSNPHLVDNHLEDSFSGRHIPYSAEGQVPCSNGSGQPDRVVLRENLYQNQQRIMDTPREPSHAPAIDPASNRQAMRRYGPQSYSPMKNQMQNLTTRPSAFFKWSPPPDQGFRTAAPRSGPS